MYVCMYVCMYVRCDILTQRECVCARARVCVCVCVWERKRETDDAERHRGRPRTHTLMKKFVIVDGLITEEWRETFVKCWNDRYCKKQCSWNHEITSLGRKHSCEEMLAFVNWVIVAECYQWLCKGINFSSVSFCSKYVDVVSCCISKFGPASVIAVCVCRTWTFTSKKQCGRMRLDVLVICPGIHVHDFCLLSSCNEACQRLMFNAVLEYGSWCLTLLSTNTI
jgi:hypothetical protein